MTIFGSEKCCFWMENISVNTYLYRTCMTGITQYKSKTVYYQWILDKVWYGNFHFTLFGKHYVYLFHYIICYYNFYSFLDLKLNVPECFEFYWWLIQNQPIVVWWCRASRAANKGRAPPDLSITTAINVKNNLLLVFERFENLIFLI